MYLQTGENALPKHEKMPMMLVKLKRRSGRKLSGSRTRTHNSFHIIAVMSPGKRSSIESANKTTSNPLAKRIPLHTHPDLA